MTMKNSEYGRCPFCGEILEESDIALGNDNCCPFCGEILEEGDITPIHSN